MPDEGYLEEEACTGMHFLNRTIVKGEVAAGNVPSLVVAVTMSEQSAQMFPSLQAA